jgi:RimJ/RimL family protein N-acetyltransferase
MNINNINVYSYLLVVPHPYSLKDAKWWINKCQKAMKEKPRKSYELGIELKKEKGMIGCVTLAKVDKYQGIAMLGYWLAEPYWRQGIMYEAAMKILDFGFNKLKLRRIDVDAFVENKGSNGLIRKLGFNYEGVRRKRNRAKSTGNIHDDNIYGLLREDYKKKK